MLISNHLLMSLVQAALVVVFITPSPEKPFSWLTERESQPVRGMKLTRSRSCRASVLSSSSPSWFEKDAADTPPSWYDKGFFVKAAEMRDIKNERLLQDEFSGRSMPTTWIERSFSDTQTAHATASSHNEMSSSPNESLSRPSDVSAFELQTSGSPSTSQEKTEETAAQKDKRIIHRSVSFFGSSLPFFFFNFIIKHFIISHINYIVTFDL